MKAEVRNDSGMKSSQLLTVTCTLRVRTATMSPTQPMATPSSVAAAMTARMPS